MPDFVATPDWSKFPIPQDDGAARHLLGARVPSIELPATDGSKIDLSTVDGLTVVYCYPRTGRPQESNPPGWDEIPSARGCTPQSCAFRDHFHELTALGVAHLWGLSTQSGDWQREAVERLHLPFALLSDEQLDLTHAMRLPTFQTQGMTLLKRLTLILVSGRVEHVFYPVFPPDQDAANIMEWLRVRADRQSIF